MKKSILVIVCLFFSLFSYAQKFSFSTNFVDYINLGTLNFEASYALSRHFTIDSGVKYNPFSFGNKKKRMQNKQQTYYVGTKFWPWYVYSGWWFSSDIRYQEYSKGGICCPKTTEGDRFRIGLGAGYSYMLTTHLNITFGFSVWTGYDKFKRYDCPVCGITLVKGRRLFFLPEDIIISLVYVF